MMKFSKILFAVAILVLAFVPYSGSDPSSSKTFANINADSYEEISACCDRPEPKLISPTKQRTPNEGKLVSEEDYAAMKRRAEVDPIVPRGVEVLAAEEMPSLPSAPPILNTFDGSNATESIFIPPDTIIGAGPNQILQGTNNVLRLSSRTNSNVQTIALDVFYKQNGKFIFDPKIYFDRLSNRFFVAAVEFNDAPQASFIHLAVPQTSDPQSLTTGWCRYKISTKSQGSWGDYPTIGMNSKWMAISTNNFTFNNNSYKKVLIKVIDKQGLVQNAASCPKAKVTTFSNAQSFTIHPAQHYTDSSLSGNPLYFISTVFDFVQNTYELWRVTGGTRPSLSRLDVTGQNYTLPPTAKHKGAGPNFDTGDTRVLQAAFRNGALWAVFTTGCSFGAPPNESCLRIARIIPTESSASITFEATQGGGVNKFFWMPGVAVNDQNDLALVFQQAGNSQFLGTAFSGKKSASANLDSFKLLKKGNCALVDFDGTRNRTGDYVGVQTDPLDNQGFWISGEYAKRFGAGCGWATTIARVKYP